MIYLFTDYDLITEDILNQLICKLPSKRKEKALRYRHLEGRISCTIGYLLFLYGYRSLHNMTDLPDFDISENEKPYLSNSSWIHFNISHSKNAVCCAFSNAPVGVDIQEIRKSSTSAILKVCSENERKIIETSENPDGEFCRIWSVKEAISKQTGDGIFRNIQNIENAKITTHTQLINDITYLTIACENTNDFTINKLSLSQLLKL